MNKIIPYNNLIDQIGQLLSKSREQARRAMNMVLVQTYWNKGRHIVEFEQNGNEKGEYGSDILNRLSADLTLHFGKGFNCSNLFYMRKFYIAFPNSGTVSHRLNEQDSLTSKNSGTLSHLLSWSQYYEILKADNSLEINFYTKQCEKENWSVRELKRQMRSKLFHRLANSKFIFPTKNNCLQNLKNYWRMTTMILNFRLI